MNLASLQARWVAFRDTPTGKLTVRTGRVLFMAALLSYLAYQFTRIGWARILDALPSDGLFYAVFAVLYLALPVTESVVYGLSWDVPFWRGFPAFLKKRVYNKDFFGYSGEVFMYAWARKATALSGREVLHIIKDNTLLSSFASTVFSVLLLLVFLFVGDLERIGMSRASGPAFVWVAVAVTVLVAGLGLRFRRRLFGMPTRLIVLAFGLYFVRLVGINALQVLQWSRVIPDVAIGTWFTFLAAQVIVSRVPLLPAKDLLFLSASVGLAGVMGLSPDRVAAMLVVLSALDKSVNLVAFVLVSAFDRSTKADVAAVPPAAEAELDALPADDTSRAPL